MFVVEPERANVDVLKRNIAAYGSRVTVLEGSIWNQRGTLQIVNPDAGSAAFQVSAGNDRASADIRAYKVEEICDIANTK